MTTETIITIYLSICGIVLVSTALFSTEGYTPDEINNFYDWLFYGVLWGFIVIKYLLKFLCKLFKT